MSRLSSNLIANLVGRSWSALLSLALVPVYVHFLGMESFGLVGFFATLQATSQILDLGLSTTINREMAKLSVDEQNASTRNDLLRTFEVVYWGMAALLFCLIWCLAPALALHWIKPGSLPPETVTQAIRLMAATLALKWPSNIYNGALMGLQHQISVNLLVIVSSTISGAGAVAALAWWSPTIGTFFGWQLSANAAMTLATAWWTWKSLVRSPAVQRARFRRSIITSTWRFAFGSSGIAMLGMLLTQADKLVLSAVLSLEQFGYYTIAWLVAGSLTTLIVPVFNSVFPVFSTMVARKDQAGLCAEYHRAARTMAALIFPPALLVAWFSHDVLFTWTRSATTASVAAPAMCILMIGTCLNGLINVPYALQLAHGYVRLSLIFNLASLIVYVPMVYWGAILYGPAGAAAGWLILNASYVLVAIPLIHRRFLPAQQWRWYFSDNLEPLLLTVLVVGISELMSQWTASPAVLIIGIALAACYAMQWRSLSASLNKGG